MTTKTQLSTFLFETHIIRTLSINNEPWFVAKDLCNALDISNPSKAIINLDEDEKMVSSDSNLKLGSAGNGAQSLSLVSESGMYTLILRCRDAVKKGSVPHRFRKWVTAEVLPQIRKTGKYEVQSQQLALPEPEKKYIDNRNKPQYTGILSKNTKRLPHPSDLAVFLCQFNGGTIAGKYNTLMGIPSSGFLCIPESESRHPQTNVANLSKNTKELAMANIITAHYNGTEVFFQDDAYLNATAIAKYFNKRPNDWLALPTTQEYIETLCKKTETRKSGNATKVGKSHFVKTVKGGKDLSQQGTWLHRRLAVAFARWLNVEFAIWCDEQIEKILISKNQPQQLALPEPEKKYIDNRNKPQYTGVLSKNNYKRLPHPTDLAVFLCQFNGGSIAGKYNTVKGIPSSWQLVVPESESRHPQPNVANLSNYKELAMTNIITAHYNGTQVFFQDDAYLNATAIAAHFGKRPNDWLSLPATKEYIEALQTNTRKSGNSKNNQEVGKSHFIKTTRGANGGTWLHRRLAVPFARWLNVEFAIWCDEQIEKILISKNQPQQLALPEPKPRGILLDEEAFYVVAKAIAKLNESTFEWEKIMDLFSELESHRNYKTAFNLGVASYNLAQSSEKIIMKNLVQMRNKVWKKEIEDFIFSNPHLQNHTENKLVHYLR